MTYIIRRLKDEQVFGQDKFEQLFHIPAGLEKAEISVFPWKENNYMPVSAAYVGWNDEGLRVYLYSRETRIRQEETRTGGSVCKDSCLEFFLTPAENKGESYFNYECSPRPCVHLGKGEGRHGRKVFYELPDGMTPRCIKAENVGWCIQYTVTNAFLQEEFGVTPESGRVMWGNFYKCGDLTQFPHYGIWHEMNYKKVPEADYHRPEYFGKMILE